MKSKIGIVQFLGSNCDQDCLLAFERHFGIHLKPIWHTEKELPAVDGLILPGGFSYGDFLRSGALAARSPIMSAINTFVTRGGSVLGICNGFQILTEAQLLPGVLLPNTGGQFICDTVSLKVAEGSSLYHKKLKIGSTHSIPIAHGDGRYFADQKTLEKLRDHGQVLFEYQNNPNGSSQSIAGILSENGRVLGMMPHPERAVDMFSGGQGLAVLNTFLETCL